jgi:putative transposase
VIGFIKGKSALHLARLPGKERNLTGESFWARGYYVSRVGLNEEPIKRYIREQEGSDESGRF